MIEVLGSSMKKTITITEEITLKRKRTIVEEENKKKLLERDKGGLKSILEFIKKFLLALL